MSRAKNLANFQTTITDGTTSVATSTAVDSVKNGTAKTWVNFDGTGTIAARDSHNLSGLTDNGTGDYQINISSAMNNSNYYVGESGCNNTTQEIRHNNGLTRTTTAVQIECRSNNASTYVDCAYAGVALQGDLA